MSTSCLIPIVTHTSNPLPKYQTADAAGMDVCAHLEDPILLKPLDRLLVPTGLYMAIPKGFEVQIRARSGLAYKHGVTLVNGIGTIDADYRGEVKILLINLSNTPFEIKNGDRIAQMVVTAYRRVHWQVVDTLPLSGRGQGGFGSTGL